MADRTPTSRNNPRAATVARRGLMLVLSSPSGAGKTTLSRRLLEIDPNVELSISVTTRARRNGEVDKRYKVLLTLKWNDVDKEVLVTLNDRADMEYPLLIGRNFLRGDFLVDVAMKEDAR